MIYKIDGKEYTVDIIKKKNKNTYVRIKDDFTIQVTTHYFMTKSGVKAILDNNYEFLKKALTKQEVKKAKDDKFLIMGVEYDVVEMPAFKNVRVVDKVIYTPDKKKLDSWLKKEIHNIFYERLKYNYQLFEEDIPFPTLRLRKMKTRWGVCNKKTKTVTLNSNLMQETMEKLDYVIIHELSHFIHFNHSADFWRLVGKYCPKYKSIRKEMRD